MRHPGDSEEVNMVLKYDSRSWVDSVIIQYVKGKGAGGMQEFVGGK